MATEPDPALSPLQVGVILDRSSSTVRRMIDCGALESFRAGSHRRVRLSEVNRFRREREKLWQALGVISYRKEAHGNGTTSWTYKYRESNVARLLHVTFGPDGRVLRTETEWDPDVYSKGGGGRDR